MNNPRAIKTLIRNKLASSNDETLLWFHEKGITVEQQDDYWFLYADRRGHVSELSDFCNACCAPENKDKESTLSHTRTIFKTPQTVRNSLAKLANYNIISKEGLGHNKTIELNKDLKIQTEGNILLDYKLYYIDTQES
jgi:hypothetical protein